MRDDTGSEKRWQGRRKWGIWQVYIEIRRTLSRPAKNRIHTVMTYNT